MIPSVAHAPQYPKLLAGYAARPKSRVVGVDCYAGITSTRKLTDWRTLKQGGGLSLNVSTGIVRVDNANGFTLGGVDFTLGGGAVLMLVGSPAGVIDGCRMQRGPLVTGFANMIAADAKSPGLTVIHSEIDGGAPNYTNGSTLISVLGGSKAVVENCWLKNSPQHALELTGADLDVSYRFNMIENIGNNGAPGNHPNLIQWENPTGTTKADVRGNTTLQRQGIRAGEGFQADTMSGVVDVFQCVGNVMLAPGTGGGQAASYLIHPGAGQNIIEDNRIDRSGAYGFIYPGIPVTESGNIDMISGTTVTQ